MVLFGSGSHGKASHLILVHVPAGIVVDLFYQGEVLPELQEVCDETQFSDHVAKALRCYSYFLYTHRHTSLVYKVQAVHRTKPED